MYERAHHFGSSNFDGVGYFFIKCEIILTSYSSAMMSFVKDVKVLPFLFVYLIRNFKEVVDELYPAYFPLQGLRLLSYELLKRGRKGIPYIDPTFLFKDVVNCVMAVVAGEIIHHEGFPFFLIIVFFGGGVFQILFQSISAHAPLGFRD